jgi:hypothetical protein
LRILSALVFLGVTMIGASAQVQTPALVNPPPAPMALLGGGAFGGVSLGMSPMQVGQRGIPYSLTQTTTTVRTLNDGTTITTLLEEKKMQDSDGRTRTELYSVRNGEHRLEMVSILDPVARTTTILSPQMKTAHVMHVPEPKPLTPEQEAQRAEALAKAKAAREARLSAGTSASTPSVSPNHNIEKLGSQSIAGVYAEGTRMTLVIPAGQEGNDREIRTMTESWFSPDLRIMVKRIVDDPRSGNMTTVVSNLDRGDPDAANFKVPEGYKVVDQ